MLKSLQTTNSESSPEETFESIASTKFLTESKFAEDIEKMVKADPDHNYITAIVEYCELHNLEVESVSKIISKPLKEKIRHDATKLNFLQKVHQSPKIKF
jgi:hypothetical protein